MEGFTTSSCRGDSFERNMKMLAERGNMTDKLKMENPNEDNCEME